MMGLKYPKAPLDMTKSSIKFIQGRGVVVLLCVWGGGGGGIVVVLLISIWVGFCVCVIRHTHVASHGPGSSLLLPFLVLATVTALSPLLLLSFSSSRESLLCAGQSAMRHGCFTCPPHLAT